MTTTERPPFQDLLIKELDEDLRAGAFPSGHATLNSRLLAALVALQVQTLRKLEEIRCQGRDIEQAIDKIP